MMAAPGKCLPSPSSSRLATAAMRPSCTPTAPSAIGSPAMGSTQSAEKTSKEGLLLGALALARGGADRLLVLLDGLRRELGRLLGLGLGLVVLAAHRGLELAHALAHRTADLREALRPEDEEQDYDEDDQLGRAD